jgi:hypothetical protein
VMVVAMAFVGVRRMVAVLTVGVGVVVMVVMGVAVMVEDCTHLDFLGFSVDAAGYLRTASTSAGCTICPVLLDQLFLV